MEPTSAKIRAPLCAKDLEIAGASRPGPHLSGSNLGIFCDSCKK